MSHIVMQRLLAPLSGKPAELWLRTFGSVELEPEGRTRFRLNAGARIEFDTYFGALFETHWRVGNPLRGLRLMAWSTEGISIEVRRAGPSGCEVVQRIRVTRDGPVELACPGGEDAGEATRLYATIHGEGGGGTIRDIAWVCDPIDAHCSLVVGFCAFGDRARALRMASHLAADPLLLAKVARIVVVDQSGNEEPERLTSRIEVVRQRNFGGTGGFARVMLEAMTSIGATHVLLLDDDIDIDPETVHRVHAFYRLSTRPIVIAGQMLDMLAASTVHEAGARFDSRRLRIEPNNRGTDATSELDQLTAPARNDYAAWFCCAMPIAAIRENGLPLPLFINYDDVEFGLRIGRSGTSTASVPGLAVWHMPGYAKGDGWRNYFYYRNIGAISAIHGLADTRSLARRFVARALKDVRHGDSLRLALACGGTEAFLLGPDTAPGSIERILGRLARLRNRFEATAHWHARLQTIALMPRALVALIRLLSAGSRAATAWRECYAMSQSADWWCKYLELPGREGASRSTMDSPS